MTDNDGATGSVTRAVSVSNAVGPVAADAFGRTVASGFGTADTGGNWTGSTTPLSVSGGTGRISLAAGAGPSAALTAVSATDVNAVVDIALDKRPVAGNGYIYLDARKSGTSGYRARLTVAPNGVLTLALVRVSSNVETTLSTIGTGLTYVAGTTMKARLSLTGTSPTTLSAKVWPATSSEPTAWTLTASDSTPERQAPGGVGLGSFLSGAATNAPITLSVDNLSVVAG